MAAALPWNKSVGAILGFMQVTNYCSKDLDSRPNKAALLAAFVNYILARNATNWQNKACFVTTNEMMHVWVSWFGKQPASAVQQRAKQTKPKREKRLDDHICRRYNEAICPNQKDGFCKTSYGRVLRHLCNAVVATGKLCEKTHTAKEHK